VTDADLKVDLEGEETLWTAFKTEGSARARERLFSRHAPFARSIAWRHYKERSRGDMDFHDLQQLAYTGLLESLDRFDPKRGAPFRYFAAHRIAGSIRDGIAHMSEVREQVSWHHRVRRERTQSLMGDISSSMEAAPAMEKLAEIAVGLAVGFMLEGSGLFVSEEEGSQQGAPAQDTAYDSLVWKDISAQLLREILNLPEREQIILRKHYIESVSFEDIAILLHVSKGRISQLHREALLLLRKRMGAQGHFKLER
jgi:RNA polymerase sigma factor for flagellar operon FliA